MDISFLRGKTAHRTSPDRMLYWHLLLLRVISNNKNSQIFVMHKFSFVDKMEKNVYFICGFETHFYSTSRDEIKVKNLILSINLAVECSSS